MAFKISARTILQLGSELISSDAVALYELIKNSIDARSKTGVSITFAIVIRESDYSHAIALADELGSDAQRMERVRSALLNAVLPTAPEENLKLFQSTINKSANLKGLLEAAKEAYRACNTITVSDTGEGMTVDDLRDIYLSIGTTSRAKQVRLAQERGETVSPYLGEKGVGRLSVMRLGKKVRIETATVEDTHINLLQIDWQLFEDAYDKPASSVLIEPTVDGPKAKGEQFTNIIISDLRSSWSVTALERIAATQIARMLDPFSWDGRRFQIRLSFNGQAIEKMRTVSGDLLSQAHARCTGKFSVDVQGVPSLAIELESSLYEGPKTAQQFDRTDLYSMAGLKDLGLPPVVLSRLGDFSFDLYWFNRQRLRALPNVGDRNEVRMLVNAWAGICLFRDGYRVLPYGDEGDDWLELDRKALSSGGYKLNTKQIIGRVRIGRLLNPQLIDQTNRQGLTETPEKVALGRILHNVIEKWWRAYLTEATRAQKSAAAMDYDTHREVSTVDSLENRAKTSLRSIQREFTGDASLLQEVTDAFLEIKDAHARAVAHIETVESQKERLTQLAGIGLMTEVIAHELARATEDTLKTLKSVPSRSLDASTLAALKTLSQQVGVIKKRLAALEPLSVPARQRRSLQDIAQIAAYVLDGHSAQFKRHKVNLVNHVPSGKTIMAFVSEGNVVQILENLINNSIYWLDVWREEHPHVVAEIHVEMLENPPRLRFWDNGPGIPSPRVNVVFEAFFSTRTDSETRRKGLGLYIARESAEMLGGSLSLVDEGAVRDGRYNIFELELKESR
ncbi:ATP-binding protein [Xanthomonas campestris]|uniref:ATP-binding protein n=1 Tax=Xanthomonas campestris TaxID=339 RepID=UPI000DF35557|nr:ATP-binding protein [Xanthomonas campestris]